MANDYQYAQIIQLVFESHFEDGATEVAFDREDLAVAADAIGIERPKNLGDVVYSFRYRRTLPQAIVDRAPHGTQWIIRGVGRAKYRFDAIPTQSRIKPNEDLDVIHLPDSTPEIIRGAAKDDEQALLALVRYNRLLDSFLGLTSYSLQNHMRTTAPGIGQVEIDEIYVAVDGDGQAYILPVQAKGGKDEIGITQAEQDLAVCADKWPTMSARPIAAQFMANGRIALFELALRDGQLVVVKERHYLLTGYTEYALSRTTSASADYEQDD